MLGVSRSGYVAWLKRVPSHQQHRKQAVQLKIRNDIVNISLHFFLEDIRSTLHPSMNGNTVVS